MTQQEYRVRNSTSLQVSPRFLVSVGFAWYCQLVNADLSSADRAPLPERTVTVNQLVAYNMAFYRKAAGLNQEELGVRLGGWSAASVSAAERSWDSGRVKKFDADEVAGIAAALGVPVIAGFLPPEDDGT